MRLSKKLFIVSLILIIIFFLTVFLLKGEWLTIGIGADFPVGTLISWLFVVAFSTLFLLVINQRTLDRTELFLVFILKFNLVLAVVWGLVSFLLSGNWAFNFNGGMRFTIWIYYTASVIVIPIIVFLIWGIILLIRKIFSSK